MEFQQLNTQQLNQFNRNGYVLIESLFSKDETQRVLETARNDTEMARHTLGKTDQEGTQTKLALWYALDDSIYSLMARTQRIVGGVARLLGGPVAHYHSKLMQKEPQVGGAWEWHQDYGYWYHHGFLFPQMLSVLTALTAATRENGCLQVLKGSHHIGRVDHGMTGDQRGADMERVAEAARTMEKVYVEMRAGDTLFFHANLLHRSDSNRSDNPRWSLITAYNLASNKPYKKTNPLFSTPINTVPDTAIQQADAKGISQEADFLED